MTDNTLNPSNGPMGELPEQGFAKDVLPEAMLEQAAIWQARLRDAAPGSAEERKVRADFSQWLLADTRHRQAHAEMEALWEALDTPVVQLIAEQQVADNSAVYDSEVATPIARKAGAVSRQAAKRSARHPESRSHFSLPAKRLTMAACLVLAVFATLGWQQDWATRWQSDYITAVGKQVTIDTDDGSHITLNTDSALAMDYSARERRVRLLKGEAWFNVASDDNRPFIVTTNAGAVRVTGTRFNVRLVGSAAIVSLDRGRVELRVPDMSKPPVMLAPGQQAVLTDSRINNPVPFDRTAVTAWLRGQFVFYNTPLSEVVDTLNRHRHGRIVLTSKELSSLKVSGIFSTDDPDAALAVIANTLPIQQTRLTDYLVLIR